MRPRARFVTGLISLWGLAIVAALPAAADGDGRGEPEPADGDGRGEPEPADGPAPPAPAYSPAPGEPAAPPGPAYDDDASLPARAPEIASYRLEATLDATLHRVDGRGTIRWVNASSRPVTELWLHLYLNAFKNERSLFLRSPFRGARSARAAAHWGHIDVHHLRASELGGAELWPDGPPRSADDPEDETDARVPLPRAVAPGERLTLEVEWSSQLPDVVERTGYAGEFHLAGQWFPKIARLEPSGTWVHFPFHPHAEFYADFGEYDVTLDVPSRMVVGATGERVASELAGDRRRDRYVARDVHDFAFTAWPDFVTVEERIDGVHASVLHPPGQRAAAEATLRALRHGLPFLGARFGRYPHPTLTVVHPPDSAPAAGGMEYPGLITTGGSVLAAHATSFLERITLHELAHQWFQGLVATDEHRHPALDEGLATYAESLAMRALEGPGDGLALGGLRISGDAWFRALAARAERDGPVGRSAADFATFQELAGLVYARTATALETIARTWGEDRLIRAIGRYARRHRFDHPGPRHLLAAIREGVGEDAAELLRAVLVEGATVDFAVEAPRSLPLRAAAGVFDQGGKRETRAASLPTGRHLGRVLVRRRGALRVPVVVELEFEDGTRERRPWDARAASVELELESKSPLVAAVVDPELHVPLDADLSNNSATRRPGSTARLVERAVYLGALAASVVGP